jgi:branched-chain amino acid transport system ATP-binding protein
MAGETSLPCAGAAILSCRGVTKMYGALAAVQEMNLDVGAGEIVGIGGPNGAGKTTFFDIISGVTKATRGSIAFRGHDISGRAADRICVEGIARTFQLNAAFDSLTVDQNVLCSAYFGRRNVLFPALGYDRPTREHARSIIDLTGLGDVAGKKAGSLTVIGRKRLMIACALATDPAILLLDEPVGGLNPAEIDEAIELIRKVRHEMSLTIVLIEHVMRFLVELCDRVVIMHHGGKIFEGATADLTKNRQVVEVYLGASAAARLDSVISRHPINA